MELLYKSTRGGESQVTASRAILQGLAGDGGLFVPERIPKLTAGFRELSGMSYQETAYEVMKLFLTDFTEEELKHCIRSAYDEKFDTEEIVPLKKAQDVQEKLNAVVTFVDPTEQLENYNKNLYFYFLIY